MPHVDFYQMPQKWHAVPPAGSTSRKVSLSADAKHIFTASGLLYSMPLISEV
jgi:hypothetical protein